MLLTFEPHPVRVLAPEVAPPLLNTLNQKFELLEECGVDAVVVEKFTRAFSRLSPEAFFRKYIVSALKARFVTVGYDFTFGAKRRGNIETLEFFCFQKQIDVKIIQPFLAKDTLVSSTLVRKYIQAGKVKQAARLLGRPYFMDGRIIKGKQRGLSIP
ncbi:MAG: hypothetical protein HYU99_06975, partial [Deltaproteobacteria bacterium]|nr:hypothetical protein [Deltaproteobacteria bacterium]